MLDQEEVVDAIENEIRSQARVIKLTITTRRKDEALWSITVEHTDNSSLDESLEGAEARWHEPTYGVADVLAVFPEEQKIVFRFATAIPPDTGQQINICPPNFLEPLKRIWESTDSFIKIGQTFDAYNEVPTPISITLRPNFHSPHLSWLREAQKEAFTLLQYDRGFLWGPPGTGKTTTIGVMLSECLLNLSYKRILLISSTNVAVDEALTSVDKVLERTERYFPNARHIRHTIKRIGNHFRPEYYRERQHLLPVSNKDLLEELIRLESQRPDEKDIQAYAEWKKKIDTLRELLRARARDILITSRLCALTATRAIFDFDLLKEFVPFDLLVIDESSQMGQAHALPLCTLAKQVVFAGDPKQLAPIVKSHELITRKWLGESMFIYINIAGQSKVMLTEQSRMVKEICTIVSNVFYDKKLIVAKDKVSDLTWLHERHISTLPELKPVNILSVDSEGIWSQNYGGYIRVESAEIIVKLVDKLLSNGVDASQIALLTPFRAQRRLIKQKLRTKQIKGVLASTVHRVQGSERLIVIFDPVCGNSNFLTDEDGLRIINVAISRAMGYFVLFLSPGDIGNECLCRIKNIVECTGVEHAATIHYTDVVLDIHFPDNFIGKSIQFPNCIGRLLGVDERDGESVIRIIDSDTGQNRTFILRILKENAKKEKLT